MLFGVFGVFLTCATSAPRTYASPIREGKGSEPSGLSPSGVAARIVRRKTTSCRLSSDHSRDTSGLAPCRLSVASARTSDGRLSPRKGLPTLKRRKSCTGSAIRAHPLKSVPPPTRCARGCIRVSAS